MGQVHYLGGGRRSADGGTNIGDQKFKLEGIKALGYEHGRYYYHSPVTQQIVELASEAHSAANLLQLQSLEWWEASYPAGKQARTKFDVESARADLMEACHRTGVFDPELLRGRGIWLDETGTQAILHEGNQVWVDGAAYPPAAAPGRHIYETAGRWPLMQDEALDDDEARLLLEACKLPWWTDECYGRLLAGWIVAAPVAGALDWRPHFALTGPRECGKSTIIHKMIKPMFGSIGFFAEGDTTAAGIRQALGRDARAIVWDEAEPQGQSGSRRLQDALVFARSMSSAGAGTVTKGGSNHRAHSFSGVASICLTSIFVQLLRDADASRFTVVELCDRSRGVPPEQAARDAELALRVGAFTPAWAGSFLARTIRLLPVLRANARIYAAAIIERWRSARLGDQLGTILAGARLLLSSHPVSLELAREEVGALPPWLGELASGSTDEEKCLHRLTTYTRRVDTSGGRRQVTASVGELISFVLGRGAAPADDVGESDAHRVLKRLGVAVRREADEVAVAIAHDQLALVYEGSDYAHGWARILERLPDARRSKNAVRFLQPQIRAVVLPGHLFDTQDPPPGRSESGQKPGNDRSDGHDDRSETGQPP